MSGASRSRADERRPRSASLRATLLSLAILVVLLGVWEFGTSGASGARVHLPGPSRIALHAARELAHPFYDNGPNDKGVGIQLAYSIARVLTGYALAALLAIPIGFVLGMSPLWQRALGPFIQVLKPISPLAWMPLALYTIRDSTLSSIFVIFICSIWPMLINTAFGVASVRRDFLDVARTHELSRWETALHVILPAAAPTIVTGMRISIGISWLVIVAAEMLVGGTGIGYSVWNEWNNLNLDGVIFSILMIGVVGVVFDQLLARALRAVEYVD